MMMVEDDWVRAAMTDDSVVVELLFRLKQAQAAPPAPKSAVAALRWGVRQPRSRSTTMRCDAVAALHKKDVDSNNISTRASPTTPLSWSGGSGGGSAASPSAADGFEETSRHVIRSYPAAASRSKGIAANETTCTTTKRSRRKKTFAELKEEESQLLKERILLKREIAAMRATYKEQSATNENLKRIKLQMNLHSAKGSNITADAPERAASSQPHTEVACSVEHNRSTSPAHVLGDDKPQPHCCQIDTDCSNRDGSFVLPDLNMMPQDDVSTETLYVTS